MVTVMVYICDDNGAVIMMIGSTSSFEARIFCIE